MARRLLAALLLAAFALAAPAVHAERSYRFPSLLIDAVVREDGTVHIVESRTVSFTGAFSGFYQSISLAGGISIDNVTVGEPGTAYEYNPAHNIGPAGTYFAERRGDELYVDWSFAAEDETRTFVLSYALHNAVLIHNDTAEFYYKFVGDDWDRGVDQVVVTLRLPSGAAPEEIRAWGHGPLNGLVEIVDGQTVRWTVSPLKANTMVEGRVAFPTYLVPRGGRQTGRDGLPSILAAEERWAAETNRQRQRARIDVALGILTAAVGILATVALWLRYGKAHPADFEGDYYRELPADYSPAELAILWSGGFVTPKEFSAALLDLARRGVIRITEETVEERGILKRKQTTHYRFSMGEVEAPLKLHEQAVLDLLFEDVWNAVREKGTPDGPPAVTLADVEQYARRRKRDFALFWKDWQETVKVAAAEHNFFESPATIRAMVFLVGLAGILVAVLAFAMQWLFSGVGLIVAGSALVMAGALMRRRTAQANNDYVRWKAFRRFLLHFSELPRQEVPALIVWEHYLVYAVTLGVAQQVIKQLQIVFPNLEDGQYRFGHGWYYYHMGTRGGLHTGLVNLTNAMQASFAQSVQLATGQSSSGSGRGGGFSGGGGGGFGGGGGGAR